MRAEAAGRLGPWRQQAYLGRGQWAGGGQGSACLAGGVPVQGANFLRNLVRDDALHEMPFATMLTHNAHS